MSTRLFSYLDRYQKNGKVVALSAVASDVRETLARWIAGQTDSVPVEVSYRSTRQVVGRLECLQDRTFKIYNDWLDGAMLHMGGDRGPDVPYIPRPFPACPLVPEWENKSANRGPEKRLRPYLLWAAMQLASPDDEGRQGVNLPFETILIPSLRREKGRISNREFGNLIGRAGRPGFATEGRSLVLLDSSKSGDARSQYEQLIGGFHQPDAEKEEIHSPLAALLAHIHEQWSLISMTNDHQAFLDWLDQTAPLSREDNLSESQEVIQALASLDGILLSMIVEIEQLTNKELSIDELEQHLIQIWQRSFAYYSTQQEQQQDYHHSSVSPNMKVYLARDFKSFPGKQWRVIPVEDGDDIYWCDPGGFHLCSSNMGALSVYHQGLMVSEENSALDLQHLPKIEHRILIFINKRSMCRESSP